MSVSIEALREQVLHKQALHDKLRYNQLEYGFAPNDIQQRFCNESAGNLEVLLTGGRQSTGKTYTLTGWIAMNLTGVYPSWYTGRRWDRPVTFAGGTVTHKQTRDVYCRYLLGHEHDRGSGWIPRHCFDDLSKDIVALTGGLRGLVDKFRCKHFTDGVFDGWSEFIVFSYQSGRENVQGYSLDAVCLDEEPDKEVKDELTARTDRTGGVLMMTFSCLQGYTDVIADFMREDAPEHKRMWIPVSVEDAPLTDEQKQAKILRYKDTILEDPELRGIPNMGEGLLYRTPDAEVVVEPFKIPAEWPRIIGIDVPHTTGSFALVCMAHDELTGTWYIYDEWKAKNVSRGDCVQALRARRGEYIPIAWPHDAKRTQEHNADVYRALGLNMVYESACYMTDDGKRSNETMAAVYDVSDQMATGKLKVFSTCQRFIAEKRTYHQKDGKIAKGQEDHLINAHHKADMMKRHAKAIFEDTQEIDIGGKEEFFGA